jgi:uncharacterized protein (DUF1499 family)
VTSVPSLERVIDHADYISSSNGIVAIRMYTDTMRYLTGFSVKVVFMGILASFFSSCAGERPNLGVSNGRFISCPSSPNCVSSQATDETHRIKPFSFNKDPDAAFHLLRQILADRRDTRITDEEAGYLRVEFYTTFFTDDGEFLLDRNSQVIHVRSASRIGYSDFGKNRSRVEEIHRDFEAAANAH